MNYLSERIEELESVLSNHDLSNENKAPTEYSIRITSLISNEIEILENIQNFITIKTLAENDEIELVEAEDVYIHDSADIKSEDAIYYIEGRVKKAWITKRDFDQIKTIIN